MIYEIKKGNHYCSNIIFPLHLGKTSLKQLVIFDDSCLYEPFDREHDYNKGMGFSYGLFDDKNSVRWGWRQHPDLDDSLEICIYCHINGQIVKSRETITVETSRAYIIKLINDDFNENIILNVANSMTSKSISLNRYIKPDWGYNKRPYFGGNNPAPHNILLTIKDVK